MSDLTFYDKYKEAIDSYQLLLQWSDQDIENSSLGDQIKIAVYKWPDVAHSAIKIIMGGTNSDAYNTVTQWNAPYEQLLEDLDFIIVEPIKAFYEGLSEKAKDHGFIGNPSAKTGDAAAIKRAYIKDINKLFGVLEAVTKVEYPRIIVDD